MRHWMIVLVLLCLTGCGKGLPQPREMSDLALMRTMAVDAGEEDGIKVTVSSGEEEPLLLSAKRGTVAAACQGVRIHGEHPVFLGHVEKLLLGEGLSDVGGVLPTLNYVCRDEELGLETEVWFVRGEAAEEISFPGAVGVKRTAGDVLTDLMENGCSFLPVVGGGYAILDGERIRGWTMGDAALGLELLQEHPASDLMELRGGAVKLDSVALTCVPVVEEKKVTGLELDLRLMVHLEERIQGSPDLSEMEHEAAAQAEQWIAAAVKQAQTENLDYLGLCRRAGVSGPEHWKLLCAQAPEKFADWRIGINCTVTMTDQRR